MGAGDSGKRRAIDAAAKGAFVGALRRGASIEDAARAAGRSVPGLYAARKRDPLFRAAWRDALERSAAPKLIAANNRRGWQLRKMRHLRFTAERKRAFIDHFAGTCDVKAAAEAVGVCASTVYKHLRSDAGFAADWAEAIATGHAALEAEAVRGRLADMARPRGAIRPQGEISAEFERIIKLLARFDRLRDGGDGRIAPGRKQSWTFDETMAAIEKKLAALNIPLAEIAEPDPEAGKRKDEGGAGGEV